MLLLVEGADVLLMLGAEDETVVATNGPAQGVEWTSIRLPESERRSAHWPDADNGQAGQSDQMTEPLESSRVPGVARSCIAFNLPATTLSITSHDNSIQGVSTWLDADHDSCGDGSLVEMTRG